MENWFNRQRLPYPFSGSNAPSHHTVFNWFHEFQRNKFSVEDAPRSGRPSTSVTEQKIDARRKIIEDDPHSTYQQVQASLPRQSIHHYFYLRKVCGGWVPLTLTDDRVQFCRHSLKRFEEGQSRRVFDIITGDESSSTIMILN